jgi:hypothetical protein
LILLSLLTTILTVALYFAPSIIAYKRRHHAFVLILIVNALLGWTAIAWVVALIWAIFTEAHVADVASVQESTVSH